MMTLMRHTILLAYMLISARRAMCEAMSSKRRVVVVVVVAMVMVMEAAVTSRPV